MKLGEAVRQARKTAGYSQRQLAAMLGMDFTSLSRFESGLRGLPKWHIPAVANFLKREEREIVQWASRDSAEAILGEEPPKFVNMDQLEQLATADRAEFLRKSEREYLVFPRDREAVAKVLCSLQVIYDPVLLGADDTLVFAGLFVSGFTYRGAESAIVVATKPVKNRWQKQVSDASMTFSVLHEIGHFQLHGQRTHINQQIADRPLYCRSGDKSPREFQANNYASAFLMPRSDILQMAGGRKRISMLDLGADMCRRFGVDEYMLRQRLRTIGIELVR